MTNVEGVKQMDILIMDFAKAFDLINHSLCLHAMVTRPVLFTTPVET